MVNSSAFKSKLLCLSIKFSGKKHGVGKFVMNPHIHISKDYQELKLRVVRSIGKSLITLHVWKLWT